MPTLTEARDKVRELAQKGLDTVESTDMTPAEQKTALDGIEADLKHWQGEVRSLEQVEERRKAFYEATGQHIGDAGAAQAPKPETRSFGEQFLQSEGYQRLKGRGFDGNWSSGSVEVKTTLTEGTSGTPGGAYWGPNAVPNLLPGVLPILYQPLTVADLFAQGSTDSPLIRYLVESTATNAAAATAEGAAKPESALAFTKVDEVLHKIATFLPVTDEVLEDYAQAMSYINARLTLFVRITEEAQLLTGDGTGANLVGLLNRSGLRTSIVRGTSPSASADNDMDVIFRQITAIRATSFLEPDAIVMHPTDWATVQLTRATGTGNYMAGGPFMGTQPPNLWGTRVVTTTAMTQGTALIGAFQTGGQVFRKGGLTLEASNSHQDFFQKNLTAIRAEERLALAVYRPGAFGTVSNL